MSSGKDKLLLKFTESSRPMVQEMCGRGGLWRVVAPVLLTGLLGGALPAFATDRQAGRVPETVLEAALPSSNDETDTPRESVHGASDGPSDVDIESFFFEHPELFERRRLYVLREYMVAVADASKSKALLTKLYRVKDVKSFERTLAQSGFKYQVGKQVTMASEALPLAIVVPLSKVDPGEALYVTARDGFKALFVLAARYSPVSLDQARPAIAQFLTNTRRRDANARPGDKAAGS